MQSMQSLNNLKGEKMRYIIDRFEGKFAILECDDESEKKILKTELSGLAKEGDILDFIDGRYLINIEATKKARALITERLKKFKTKNPSE